MPMASSSSCADCSGFSRRLIITQCLFSLFILVSSTPPADPIKCVSGNTNCTVTNSYGTFPDRSICRAARVVYPTSESELISAVASATRSKTKVKVATRFSHSVPKLVCTDGQDGMIISTKFLNRTLVVDKIAMRMTVESGVSLRQLISEAAEAGMALPHSPYWWGLTVGGMLGTGAHGSGLWGRGSAVHEYVEEITVVSPGDADDGFAKVRVLNRENSPEEFEAAKVSLGVLGVISRVTFQLEPMFKRSITFKLENDSNLAEEVFKFGKSHEFGDIIWYPSQREAVYRIDDRVPSNTTANGLFEFFPFRSQLSAGLALIRSKEELQEALRDANGKCTSADITTSLLYSLAYGLTNNGVIFRGYPVIGNHNRLQSTGTCLDSLSDALITACPWDPRIKGEFYFQLGFSVPLSTVKDFILDVQKLVDLEPKSLCGVELYNGIILRYVTASSAYLGKDVDSVDFDITFYRSKDPMAPRLYEDILEEIEQMALFKYGALPHWGKNRNLAFEGVIKKYKNAPQFLRIKETLDPLGLFSSQWTDQILGLKDGVTIIKNGCALEGLCICSEDIHCAPSKGYFCRPGKIYKDARVCTRTKSAVQAI